MIRVARLFAILLTPIGLLAFVVALPEFFDVLVTAVDPSVSAVDPTISERWLHALRGFFPALAFWGTAISLWLLSGIAQDVRANHQSSLNSAACDGQ